MNKPMLTLLCIGSGFLLGANRWVPVWLVIVLAVLGAGLWGVAEWMERRNPDDGL